MLTEMEVDIICAGGWHVQQRLLDWLLHRLHGNPGAGWLPAHSSTRNVLPGVNVRLGARDGSRLQSTVLCRQLTPSTLIPHLHNFHTRTHSAMALHMQFLNPGTGPQRLQTLLLLFLLLSDFQSTKTFRFLN